MTDEEEQAVRRDVLRKAKLKLRNAAMVAAYKGVVAASAGDVKESRSQGARADAFSDAVDLITSDDDDVHTV